VLPKKSRKGGGQAVDAEAEQLSQVLGIQLEELLEELPAMRADDKGVEPGKIGEQGVPAAEEGAGVDRFLSQGLSTRTLQLCCNRTRSSRLRPTMPISTPVTSLSRQRRRGTHGTARPL